MFTILIIYGALKRKLSAWVSGWGRKYKFTTFNQSGRYTHLFVRRWWTVCGSGSPWRHFSTAVSRKHSKTSDNVKLNMRTRKEFECLECNIILLLYYDSKNVWKKGRLSNSAITWVKQHRGMLHWGEHAKNEEHRRRAFARPRRKAFTKPKQNNNDEKQNLNLTPILTFRFIGKFKQQHASDDSTF